MLIKISTRISKPSFDTWIASASGKILDEHTLVITEANDFSKEWIKEGYEHLFMEVLKELTGQDFKVKVIFLDIQKY
ncbi:DnaA N-terminal domain-containing protein [Niallia sp. 03091]|uniref:DnaA N-terminal domain-containing protein n=1 Tax=Niallia sp. 03091 TaxID=3458059 RepID=UPI0040449D36